MSATAFSNVALAATGELPRQETPRNAVQAAVYRHIMAWMPRTRVIEPSGRRWLIRTADEFRTVGKGLPWAAWTIRKALRALAADGWIELRHGTHPFGDREFQQHCSWIALLDREQEEKPNVAVPPVRVQQNALRATFGATFDPPLEQHSSITSKVSTRRQGNAASQVALPRTFGAAPPNEAEEGSDVGNLEIGTLAEALSATLRVVPDLSTGSLQIAAPKEGAMPTADEVMASLKAKKPPQADLSKPLKAQALHHEFARAWIETYPGEAVAPATARRFGQMKNLIAYLRTQHAADAEIVAMVRKATTQWPDFVSFVAARGGPKLSEARPSVAAMLTHRDKLVNYQRAPNAPEEAAIVEEPDHLKPIKKHWTPGA